MSVAADSSTDKVYVRLLGEGTVVYRSAPVAMVGEDSGRLLRPEDYDDEDEDWEFKPGSVVRLEIRSLEGKSVLVAIALVTEST